MWKSRRVASWLLWSSLAIHAPIALVAALDIQQPQPGGDFDNYYDIGTRPGRPWVDFPVEFPVGAVQTFRTLAPLAGTRGRFVDLLVIINVAADLAIAGALTWGWGLEAAACYALVVIPLVDLFFLRMDLWSTALATIGVAAWRRGRPSAAAIAFGVGAAFKLWPVMMLPLLLVRSGSARRVTAIATAAATGLVIAAVWLWVAGWSGLYQVLTFRGARGFEVESTVGGIWMLVDRSSMRVEQGAWRIGASNGMISLTLFALGALPCLWMIWRGARTKHVGAGWAGGLSALLAMSALLSPQFAVWLAPASGIAWVEGDTRIAVLTGLAVFLSNLVFKSFAPLMRGAPRALLTVQGRNLLLVCLAIVVVRLLLRSPLAPEPSAEVDLATADGRLDGSRTAGSEEPSRQL